jgi:predicted aspartyl protease
MKPRRVVTLTLALACLAAASASAQTEPPADALIGEVPFLTHSETNRVFIDLSPEGKRPFRLLLDTGASDSVLTPGYARELGVTVRSHRSRPNQRETRLGRDLQFWIDTESSAQISRTGWDYGLLGGTFLAEYVLEIDFPGRRVRFLDPEKFAVPKQADGAGEAVLPLRVMGNRPFVKILVEGKEVEVLLDTGAPQTVGLSGRSAKRAGYEPKRLARLGMGGVLGPIESYLVEASELALGPFRFAPAPLVLAPNGMYNMGGSTDSLIGYDLLEHFVMRIDYRRGRLWLRRIGDRSLSLFGLPWADTRETGAMLVISQSRILVQGVLPESPAERLGLMPGDSIALSEELVDTEELARFHARIRAGEALRVQRITAGESEDVIEEVELPAPK